MKKLNNLDHVRLPQAKSYGSGMNTKLLITKRWSNGIAATWATALMQYHDQKCISTAPLQSLRWRDCKKFKTNRQLFKCTLLAMKIRNTTIYQVRQIGKKFNESFKRFLRPTNPAGLDVLAQCPRPRETRCKTSHAKRLWNV